MKIQLAEQGDGGLESELIAAYDHLVRAYEHRKPDGWTLENWQHVAITRAMHAVRRALDILGRKP